ncbi:MAG: phosphotriesterase family protein [Solirubrobacteraceae bacterium]|nr:MAG: phosphotriesterase-related protein [Solirubrobacterales bacterium]
MTEVATLDGVVDANELGTTLMHEHVFVLSPEMQTAYPGFEGWDPERGVADAREKLTALKQRGVDTIVDLSVVGTGRDVALVARAAEGTGLRIVVATGIYTYKDLPKAFYFRGPGTELGGDDELMISLFTRDIEEGIQGTTIKAGILKCATDEPGLTPDVERVLRAVAAAHKRTGVPISTHTHATTERGLDQQRIFEQEGVDLSRVVIGHCGDTTDCDYLEKLVSRGSYIGMDRFGIDIQLPFEDRVETVAEMCRRGHAGRLVLSHDAACFIDWLPQAAIPVALPNWHYHHIHDDVLPALRERGVSDQQIDQMLVVNPREIFSRQASY